MCSKCPVNIKVVNKHHGHQADGDRKVYIGKGSPLGNPFIKMNRGRLTNRDEAIEQYRAWLMPQLDGPASPVTDVLNEIAFKAITGGVDLVCYCAPKHCHGDVIKTIVLHYLERSGALRAPG